MGQRVLLTLSISALGAIACGGDSKDDDVRPQVNMAASEEPDADSDDADSDDDTSGQASSDNDTEPSSPDAEDTDGQNSDEPNPDEGPGGEAASEKPVSQDADSDSEKEPAPLPPETQVDPALPNTDPPIDPGPGSDPVAAAAADPTAVTTGVTPVQPEPPESADADPPDPDQPPTDRDVVITDDGYSVGSGDAANPLCDLGGGNPEVQVCLSMASPDVDCATLGLDSQVIMDVANSNYDCGHPWIAGIICGPVAAATSNGVTCCWEMDGHCQEDQMLPTNPREIHLGDDSAPPAGCDEADVPTFPVVSGDYEIAPGNLDQPLCDLGGGKPQVRVCAPLISAEEGCHDLIYDGEDIMRAANSYTCDGSWTAGIRCGPVQTEIDSGPACCWELDGR